MIKNADNVLGTKCENFSIPDSVNIDVSDQLYNINADHGVNCDKNVMLKKLGELMSPGETFTVSKDREYI